MLLRRTLAHPFVMGTVTRKVGCLCSFRKQYFTVGIVGGLEVPSLQRDRAGVIVKQTRLRPNARTARSMGAFMYTVQF